MVLIMLEQDVHLVLQIIHLLGLFIMLIPLIQHQLMVINLWRDQHSMVALTTIL